MFSPRAATIRKHHPVLDWMYSYDPPRPTAGTRHRYSLAEIRPGNATRKCASSRCVIRIGPSGNAGIAFAKRPPEIDGGRTW